MLSKEEIRRKVDDFPTLPTIYTTLMEVISNPRTTVQDVADVIIKDQAATVKILRVVNSPIFGIQGTVNNITQAIFFLGFNEVKNIVLTLSIMDIFNGTPNVDTFSILDLWKHSIAVAVTTKLLGITLKIRNTEDYFISGIIHDIGILFYLKNYPDVYNKLFRKAIENNEPIATYEKQEFGFNHYSIGDIITEKWKLPNLLRSIVRNQHKGTVDGKTETMLSCIHLGNIITHALNLDYQKDRMVENPNFAIWNQMHFEPGTIKNLYPSIMDNYNQSVSVLQIKP